MYVMTLHRSSIGKKVIMAVTGVIGLGFVLLHMYGNLKAFLGPAYSHLFLAFPLTYSHFIHSF